MAKDPICGMEVDESSGLKLTWNGQDYYFCSERCLNKFIEINKITVPCVSCAAPTTSAWWTNKVLLMLIAYLAVFLLGAIWTKVAPLRDSLLIYLRTITIPIIVGLLLGGIIDWLVPSEYVSKLLASRRKRTIIYSVITGFLMSACSHGILALAIQLYKKGASPPAVVAFLLASPWANLPLTIIMFGFFGVKAFFVVIGAVAVALVTGYIFMVLEKRNLIEHNPNTIEVGEEYSIANDVRRRIKAVRINYATFINGIGSIWQGSVALANMVLWWIMIGALLASIAAAYLPAGFMQHYMGPTLLGMMITLLLATIIEICSEGSAPLAFEIYRQTGAIGNSFVFLMAGVVTDYTEIGLLWTNIGWKTAVWLPIITVPQVVVIGLVANLILK
ncbi:MAG: permease [Candidatus Margulisbacteria bacterium]|nr:permease [Candidatus Margulisiibacteriota bacterium]